MSFLILLCKFLSLSHFLGFVAICGLAFLFWTNAFRLLFFSCCLLWASLKTFSASSFNALIFCSLNALCCLRDSCSLLVCQQLLLLFLLGSPRTWCTSHEATEFLVVRNVVGILSTETPHSRPLNGLDSMLYSLNVEISQRNRHSVWLHINDSSHYAAWSSWLNNWTEFPEHTFTSWLAQLFLGVKITFILSISSSPITLIFHCSISFCDSGFVALS